MKWNILFLAVSLIVVFSCSSDDEFDIVGTWTLESIEFTCTDGSESDINVSALDGCVSFDGDVICIELVFNQDATGSFQLGEGASQESGQFNYNISEPFAAVSICPIDEDECMSIPIIDGDIIISEKEENCTLNNIFKKQ